jgi:hypothetical protein
VTDTVIKTRQLFFPVFELSKSGHIVGTYQRQLLKNNTGNTWYTRTASQPSKSAAAPASAGFLTNRSTSETSCLKLKSCKKPTGSVPNACSTRSASSVFLTLLGFTSGHKTRTLQQRSISFRKMKLEISFQAGARISLTDVSMLAIHELE